MGYVLLYGCDICLHVLYESDCCDIFVNRLSQCCDVFFD